MGGGTICIVVGTCYASDPGLKLARVSNHLAPETHADDVDVVEVQPLLQVEEADQEADLATDHPRVLVGQGVPLSRARIPVDQDHVCIFLG